MIAVLEHRHSEGVGRLFKNALVEMDQWDELDVQLVPDADASGTCSVAGAYTFANPRAHIRVARSGSQRRRQFTALHELGHHLQQTDISLGQRVVDVRDPEFEDASCDMFASRILLPDDLVNTYIVPRGPTAQSIVDLYEKSEGASRAACAVRAVERMTGFGAAVVCDAAGIVTFATAKGMFPPARGSDQSSTPLINAALRRPGVVTNNDATFVLWRNGSRSDQLYGQAAWCDGFIVAVLAETGAAWRPFAPPRPGTGQSSQFFYSTCDLCGDQFEVSPATDRCAKCSTPYCGSGHCRCSLATERTCEVCWMRRHTNLFVAGMKACKICLEEGRG
jgi:hypothetical protein